MANQYTKRRQQGTPVVRRPVFTLKPTDNFTPVLMKEWIRLATAHDAPEEKITEAKAILRQVEEWRTANPTLCKTPD